MNDYLPQIIQAVSNLQTNDLKLLAATFTELICHSKSYYTYNPEPLNFFFLFVGFGQIHQLVTPEFL